jgi:hypothetical protein
MGLFHPFIHQDQGHAAESSDSGGSADVFSTKIIHQGCEWEVNGMGDSEYSFEYSWG